MKKLQHIFFAFLAFAITATAQTDSGEANKTRLHVSVTAKSKHTNSSKLSKVFAEDDVSLDGLAIRDWTVNNKTPVNVSSLCPKEDAWIGVSATGMSFKESTGVRTNLSDLHVRFVLPAENSASPIPCLYFSTLHVRTGLSGLSYRSKPFIEVFDMDGYTVTVKAEITY
jgi:hypothetical protein